MISEEVLKPLLKLNNIERVDIGTIDRPPAYSVDSISYKKLHQISMMFDSSLPIHISSRKDTTVSSSSYNDNEILNTLDKRALTKEDIEILFDENSKIRLKRLLEVGEVVEKDVGNLKFFLPSSNIIRKLKR